jgi:hypothetical protein
MGSPLDAILKRKTSRKDAKAQSKGAKMWGHSLLCPGACFRLQLHFNYLNSRNLILDVPILRENKI